MTDVYALGAILYEMLAGHPPFRGAWVVETLEQVRFREPVPPSRSASVHRDLETICRKALAKEQSGRYASALDLADDLARFSAGEPIVGRREGFSGKLARRVRRNRVAAASVLAVLLAVPIALLATRAAYRNLEIYKRQASRADAIDRIEKSIVGAIARPRLGPADLAEIAADLARLDALNPDLAGKLRASRDERLRGSLPVFTLRIPFPAQDTVFEPGSVRVEDDWTLGRTPGTVVGAPILYTRFPSRGDVTFAATFAESWAGAPEVGLVLQASRGHIGKVRTLAVAPDGTVLATGGEDHAVKLWDCATGRVKTTLRGLGWLVEAVAFAPKGTLVAAVGGMDLKLWDVATGLERPFLKRRGEAGWLTALAFSADGKTLATGSTDGVIRLWDTATGRKALEFKGHDDRIARLQLSRDGQPLLDASGDGVVQVWDAANRLVGSTLPIPARTTWGATFSPDGTVLAAIEQERGTLRVWDVATGAPRTPFEPLSGLTGIAFSRDSKTLAAGVHDGTLRLLDPETGAEQSRQRVDHDVTLIEFAPDGHSAFLKDNWSLVESWNMAAGLVRVVFRDRGLAFLLRPGVATPSVRDKAGSSTIPASFRAARSSGGSVVLEILRDGDRLRERRVKATEVPDGPLHLEARREGDRFVFRVADLPPLEFQDVFAPRVDDLGVFGIAWPDGVRLAELRAEEATLPPSALPLERGDELYGRGRFAEALASYQEQAGHSAAGGGQEARYKQALCLIALGRPDQAAPVLERLAAEPGERWPPLASCQLWMFHLRRGRFDDADTVYDTLSARYHFEDLARRIPGDLRSRILGIYLAGSSGLNHYRPDPRRVANAERGYMIENLLDDVRVPDATNSPATGARAPHGRRPR